jgi:hypothetical protein
MQSRIAAAIWLSLLLVGCQRADSQKMSMAAQPASLVCTGFVADIGSKEFADCVAYQQSRDPGPSVPPYRLDQYNNRVDAEGYEVDSHGRRMPVQSPYAFRGPATSGQLELRDEYGNRYDARGNRIR